MKIKFIICLSLGLLFFGACKKDQPGTEEPVGIETDDLLEDARDSISYSIDGSSYHTARLGSFSGAGNYQPYSKVDSIINNAYYISGIKDSVLYSRKFAIYNDQRTVNVTFIKTYHKDSMRQLLILTPKNMTDLFTVGPRNYAIDFERDNVQNGIAIGISDGFKTYGSNSFYAPPLLSPDAQQSSKFQITSFKKLKSGTYVLEATFNATVFNSKKESKKLESGYLRLVLKSYDLIF